MAYYSTSDCIECHRPLIEDEDGVWVDADTDEALCLSTFARRPLGPHTPDLEYEGEGDSADL